MKKAILLDLNKIRSNAVLKAAFILVLVSLIFIQIGVSKFKKAEKSQQEFINVESRLIERYPNYRVYGFYGFRLLVSPSPLFILTPKSAPFCALQTNVDNAARLAFEKPETPELIFKKALSFLDFTTVLFFGGSILCLLLGYFALKDKKYLDFLKLHCNDKAAYFSLFLSRLIFIASYFVVLLLTLTALFFLNGIRIELALIMGIIWLFIPAIFTMIFCVAVGMFAGALKEKGLILAFIIWAVFALAIPEGFNEIVDRNASKLDRYIFELMKISVLMNFEKEVYQEKVKSKAETPDEKFIIDKRMTQRYKDKDSKEIEALEKENLEATRKLIAKLHLLSILSPFTNFKSTSNEIGGMGYNTYISFYQHNQREQKGFFLFYKKNVYDNPQGKVVPYLKEGENIFRAAPTIPQFFIFGVLISVVFIAIFLFPGYLAFRKSRKDIIQEVDIRVKSNRWFSYFFTKDEKVESTCINLAGKGKIQVDGKEIPGDEIFYLPDPGSLPIKLKLWNKFFDEKPGKEPWEIFFNAAINSGKKLILGHHFIERRKKDEIDTIRKALAEAGKLFLEIGREKHQWEKADKPICWKGDTSIDINDINDALMMND
jgi:hypothetical protein